MLSKIALAAVAAVAGFASSSVHAQTYSAAGDFALSNPNGVWSYGHGLPGAVAPLTGTSTSCYSSTSNLSCFNPNNPNSVPAVGAPNNGSSSSFGDPSITTPATDLFIHPGFTATDNADVVFTAPDSGSYSLAGYFERLDSSANGNGVIATVSNNGTLLNTFEIVPTNHNHYSFDQTLTLASGDRLTFSVGNNGDVSYDSTGLNATITEAAVSSAPEPGAWALMFAGVAVIGAMLRRRRQGVGSLAA